MIYKVPVTRSESVTRTFQVEASSIDEATDKALQEAYDYGWPRSGGAVYVVDHPEEKPKSDVYQPVD